MVEEKLKVVIVFDYETKLYEVLSSKLSTFIESFDDLQDCLNFCKERNFEIIDNYTFYDL